MGDYLFTAYMGSFLDLQFIKDGFIFTYKRSMTACEVPSLRTVIPLPFLPISNPFKKVMISSATSLASLRRNILRVRKAENTLKLLAAVASLVLMT